MFKAVNTHGGGEGGGNFLKIAPGSHVNGVFRGEVYQFFQLWPFGGEKVTSDKPFAGASMRFRANFVVYENKKFVTKVFEFASGLNNDLAKLAKVCDVRKTKVMISRDGEGKNTRYSVLPVLNEPLSPSALQQVEQVKLNILNTGAVKPQAQQQEEEPFPDPTFFDGEPMPDFDSNELPF